MWNQRVQFRWVIRLAFVLATLMLAPRAFSQSEEEVAGARSAATGGAKAFESGQYAQAIDLFSRAESLVHAPPHLLYLARSHAKLGHLVAAQEAYLKITREKLAGDAPDAFKDAQAKAREELAALEPRIPSLTITLKGEGAEGAVVTMDDVKVPAALVGVPHPVDPGQHELVASGNGVKSQPANVSLAEGAKQSVELTLEPAPGATAPGEPAAGGSESGAIDTGAAPSGGNGMRIGAYVALGVGVVGLAAGTVFALSAKSKFNDADAICNLPNGACPPNRQADVQKLDDDGKSAKTLATVGFVVGGVGLATGVTLLILSGKHEQEQAAGIRPWVGLGSAGVSGRF
jgi:hypothetical protein